MYMYIYKNMSTNTSERGTLQPMFLTPRNSFMFAVQYYNSHSFNSANNFWSEVGF